MNAIATKKPRLSVVDGQVSTTSLAVAEHFGKNHKDVLRAIRNLDCSLEFNGRNFAPVTYQDEKGEARPMYRIYRDGFSFLAMGFTGKEAAAWKEAYINTFNMMERMLVERHEAEVDAEAEAYREDILAMARQVVVEVHAQAIADAAQYNAVQLAGRLKIPHRPSREGGYLSEAFMLIFFGLERRFTDAALLWTLYDDYSAYYETVKLSARQIVQTSRNALSRMSVYHSRYRLIARGVLVNIRDPQSWRIDSAQFERMMRETQLVAHVQRVPTLGDEPDTNAKLSKWLEAMPEPKAMQ
jgi:Rha family phage regulatory protein